MKEACNEIEDGPCSLSVNKVQMELIRPQSTFVNQMAFCLSNLEICPFNTQLILKKKKIKKNPVVIMSIANFIFSLHHPLMNTLFLDLIS